VHVRIPDRNRHHVSRVFFFASLRDRRKTTYCARYRPVDTKAQQTPAEAMPQQDAASLADPLASQTIPIARATTAWRRSGRAAPVRPLLRAPLPCLGPLAIALWKPTPNATGVV